MRILQRCLVRSAANPIEKISRAVAPLLLGLIFGLLLASFVPLFF